jgi:hypothetical protein
MQKVTISFAMSVRLSVCLSIRPYATTLFLLKGFSSNLIWSIFWKSVEQIQVYIKSDSYNGYFIWKQIYICDNISLSS